MIRKLGDFLKLGFFDQLNAVRILAWRVKSRCFHRPFFGSFGRRSFLASPILVSRPDRIFIGSHVTIRQGARLEVIQTDPARVPTLEIGDNTNIEQNVHFACHGHIHIGANVSITANCAIVDITHPVEAADPCGKIGARILDETSWVHVGDGAFLGIGTVVLPKVRIGEGAFIGANSVVTRDIPPFAIAAGVPAKVLRIYRKEDCRMAGSGAESCK